MSPSCATVKGPRKLGLHMSPRHNWQILRKHEEKKRSHTGGDRY